MKWFYNLKIGIKILIGFIAVTIIAGMIGIVGIINLQNINALNTDMYVRHTATMPDLANMSRAYLSQKVALRNLYLISNANAEKSIDEQKGYIDELEKNTAIITASMAQFEAGIKDATVRDEF